MTKQNKLTSSRTGSSWASGVFTGFRAWLDAAATNRGIAIALVLYLASVTALTLSDAQVEKYAPGAGKPDLRFGYAHAELVDLFSVLGEAGRQAYAVNLVIDTVMPLLFAIVTLLVIARAAPRWFGLLSLAPVLFMVLDLIENAAFGLMLAQYPGVGQTLVAITSWITMVKLSAFAVAMPTLLIGLAALMIGGLYRRRLLRT
jgi:hypothetical protein